MVTFFRSSDEEGRPAATDARRRAVNVCSGDVLGSLDAGTRRQLESLLTA